MGKLIFILILVMMFYVLYIRGYLVINAKTALTFIGSIRGKNKCTATFSSCNGYMKRVILFKENKVYHFHLKSTLSNGKITVVLQDSSKQKVLELTDNQSTDIYLHQQQRYYLVFYFSMATGSYELNWN